MVPKTLLLSKKLKHNSTHSKAEIFKLNFLLITSLWTKKIKNDKIMTDHAHVVEQEQESEEDVKEVLVVGNNTPSNISLFQQNSSTNCIKEEDEDADNSTTSNPQVSKGQDKVSNHNKIINITPNNSSFTEMIIPRNALDYLSVPLSSIPLSPSNCYRNSTSQDNEDARNMNETKNDNDCIGSQITAPGGQQTGGSNQKNDSYSPHCQTSQQLVSPMTCVFSMAMYIKQMFHDFISDQSDIHSSHEERRMTSCIPNSHLSGTTTHKNLVVMRNCSSLMSKQEEECRQKERMTCQHFCNNPKLNLKGRQYENIAAIEQLQHVFLSKKSKGKTPKPNIFVIHLQDIQLHDHPLILDEEKHAIDLQTLYDKFLESQKKKKDLESSMSINACRIVDELVQLLRDVQSSAISEENNSNYPRTLRLLLSNKYKVTQLYKNLICSITKLISAEHTIYSNYDSVIQKWKELSLSRKIQGFQCTSLILTKIGQQQNKRRETDDSISKSLLVSLIRSFEQMKDFHKALPEAIFSAIDNIQSLECEIESLSKMIEIMHAMRCSYCFKLNLKKDKRLQTMNSRIMDIHQKKRLTMISSERYVARLIIDDKIVHSSCEQTIDWPSWKITFNQKFYCYLQVVPKNSCIQICHIQKQQGIRVLVKKELEPGKNHHCSSSIHVTIPSRSDVENENYYTSFHECLPIQKKQLFNTSWQHNNTHGEINIRTFLDSSNQPDIITHDHSSNNLKYLQGTRYHLQSAGSIFGNAQISCPEILLLNYHSMEFCFSGTKYNYLNTDELQEPLRHSLIKQRREWKWDNSNNNTPMPLCDSDITPETRGRLLSVQGNTMHIKVSLKLYQESSILFLQFASNQMQDFVTAVQIERPLSNRKAAIEYIKCIKKCQKQGNVKIHSKMTFENIIHDASRIEAAHKKYFMSNILIGLLPPRKRSLYPQQHLVPTKMPATMLPGKSRILVTIIHAYDMPLRNSYLGTSMLQSLPPFATSEISQIPIQTLAKTEVPCLSSKPPLIHGNKVRTFVDDMPVKGETEITTSRDEGKILHAPNVFVQIKVGAGGSVYKTRSMKSITPSWKQVIEIPLPFNRENAITPHKMQDPSLALDVIIFDMVNIDVAKGGGYYDDEITIFQEKRYIGYFNVPLSIAAQNTYHSHEYLLVTPDVTFGYSHRGGNTLRCKIQYDDECCDEELQNDNLCMLDQQQRKKDIKLSMKVVVEPPVTLCCDLPRLNLPCDENQKLLQLSSNWISCFKKANRKHHRWASIFVECSNGKQQFITRVLSPQTPPPNCQASVFNCAHFVSLIPLSNNLEIMQRVSICHIHFPSQHTLSFTTGNWFSHAVLLANYFLYLTCEQPSGIENFEVYLLFGNSVLEGQVVS
jgi:hypothetical protein